MRAAIARRAPLALQWRHLLEFERDRTIGKTTLVTTLRPFDIALTAPTLARATGIEWPMRVRCSGPTPRFVVATLPLA
jgi:hypothetical protein